MEKPKVGYQGQLLEILGDNPEIKKLGTSKGEAG